MARFSKTPVDYPDVELARYDLIGSQDPAQDAYRLASSIQRTLMSLSGPLFKFALLQTRVDEFYLFACCHHIVVDGIGLTLVCHRIADIYSAMASGGPIPPAFFGSLSDLIESELEYEASTDYLDDQAYWTKNLPPESEPRYRLAQAAAGGRDDGVIPTGSIGPFRRRRDPSVVAGVGGASIVGDYCGVRAPGACVRHRESGGGAGFSGKQACASGGTDGARNDLRVCATGVEGFAGVDGRWFLSTCRHANARSAAASAVPGARY